MACAWLPWLEEPLAEGWREAMRTGQKRVWGRLPEASAAGVCNWPPRLGWSGGEQLEVGATGEPEFWGQGPGACPVTGGEPQDSMPRGKGEELLGPSALCPPPQALASPALHQLHSGHLSPQGAAPQPQAGCRCRGFLDTQFPHGGAPRRQAHLHPVPAL